MASVGHVAVGIAVARTTARGGAAGWRAMLLWCALSMLPDADVIGFAFGVEYGDPWGHRGATHSFAAAIAIGVQAGAAARRFGQPFVRTTVLATAVLASHAMLDTMTDGGLGCALFWPFDLTRFFAPWRPIPVAPIGLHFLSPYGAIVAATELVLFSPLLLLSRRARRLVTTPIGFAIATIWLAALWLMFSTDPVRQSAIGLAVRENTAYAAGFSEAAFDRIQRGQSDRDVHRLLGAPIGESWFYASPGGTSAGATAGASLRGCQAIRAVEGRVVAAIAASACEATGIRPGSRIDDVGRRLGPPTEACWQYSWSPEKRPYRLRAVCLVENRVELIVSRWSLGGE
ncbi:MAG TPA: metal-dependent hydrolase [Vicinamibacterales bacterium]|nr:metal-dependent hydrolase [Vicinamibacterales bacterium]